MSLTCLLRWASLNCSLSAVQMASGGCDFASARPESSAVKSSGALHCLLRSRCVAAGGNARTSRSTVSSRSGVSCRCTTELRARLRQVFTMAPHNFRPSHQRSYEAFVRKTSSSPIAVDTMPCTPIMLATESGYKKKWSPVNTAATSVTENERRAMTCTIEPRTAKNVERQT